MHELSLSQGMMNIIRDQAAQQNFVQVNLVRLEIGSLSCVDPAALAFCFESVTRGTLADGATLDIVAIEGQAWCRDCEAVVVIAEWGQPCSQCGGYNLELRDGDQIRIKELEVE